MVKPDIHFRRMIRCVVGAPSSICWRDPWHEILHIWNQRVREMVEACHIKTWAEKCAYQHWKFACYIMSLPHERWARRMLQWQPFGRGPAGRPAMHWASKFEQFSRIKPPPQLQTHGGVTVDVLDRVSTHKWLGCLLHAGGCHDADIDFHLQSMDTD